MIGQMDMVRFRNDIGLCEPSYVIRTQIWITFPVKYKCDQNRHINKKYQNAPGIGTTIPHQVSQRFVCYDISAKQSGYR